ncbi:MAG: DUF4965 domain-containing protein, partial [Actinobacteria bacterium]|nr:DUF4965 domain-containing protein [Actinomycetota bacterium]
MEATPKERPVWTSVGHVVFFSALVVVSVLLCGDAFASGPGQVIVELQQNNGSEITRTSDFYGQEIAGTDGGARQAYKFQRERHGRHFTYVVANLVPGAAYEVELSFVEHDQPSSGLRVFNVNIGDARVLDHLDVFAQVGANHACQFRLGAAADPGGLLGIVFRSDEPGCAGDATVSTITVRDASGDVVEIDATASRHRMDPPVRHYNNGRQNTLETILGRLGSRISLNLLPQRLASRVSPLGTWTGDLSELVIALKQGPDIRCLPFTDRFPAWESIEQAQGMTHQSFDCRSPAVPLEMSAVFRSPFYPGDEKLSTAPFFYVDLTVRNTGEGTVSGEVLLARPHKEGFQECGMAGFSGPDTAGYTFEASYQYQEETVNEHGARSAVEALAVPSGEKEGVRFRGLTKGEFTDFSPDSIWGWRSPDGYPLTYDEPRSPTFTFYPRGYSGAVWSIDGLEPGGTATRHFILAGYVPGTVLSVKNRHYQDGGFRFKYRGHFSGARDVADYAAASRWEGDGIEEKSEFFDSLFASDDYFHLDTGYLGDVRDLMACAFQSYLTNTWWVHSDAGRDWFSVWEGTWMRLHGTVDVEYNQAWFYLELWPELLRMIMDQWLLYTESNEMGEYLPHDVGILDTAHGQVYEHPMPVEENTNFILLLYRYWQRTGDTPYVQQRFPEVRRLVDFLVNCDTNNNGLPDVYTRNTLDDGPPALEGSRDQTYLGVKCMAAYRAAREMAGAQEAPDADYAGRCGAQVELINQTLEYDQWLSDHFAVCQDGGVEAAGREAYSIHSGNGLLYLLGAGRNVGLTSGNTDRMRRDVEGATGRTLRKYGCTHTSDDPTRMWVSANLWRDQVACHLGASPGDGGPLAMCTRYWDLERYFGTYLQGGYWDGVVYPACGVSASPIWGVPAARGNTDLDTGIIAERPIYFDYHGNVTGGHVVMGASEPGATFYFAEGTCRPGFDPYICIQNPGSTTAAVRVTYMLGDGTTRTQELEIGARSRATVVVKDFLGEGDDPGSDFSAKVET